MFIPYYVIELNKYILIKGKILKENLKKIMI